MDYSYIFKRQHPLFVQRQASWERNKAAYSGGTGYIQRALIQHVSEIDPEFTERLNRAYYFNYPRKIARLITQYILSGDPVRTGADPVLIEDFSRSKLRANEVMRQFSTLLNVYGSAWMLVEMPSFEGTVNIQRKTEEHLYPYAVALSPLKVPDWAEGSDGELLWAVVEEDFYENSDPFSEAVSKKRRRLWTRDSWMLFEEDSGTVKAVSEGKHALGRVPLLHVCEIDGYGMDAVHWFDDIVRISDAVLNNESEAQMNIIKQMFGLLVISENFARGSRSALTQSQSDDGKFSHILARSAAIWESGDESGISRYISPNGAETNIIRNENNHLKNELFDIAGLTIIRETREKQSAESKAWDHQQICQFLLNRVDLLEQTESAVWQIMNLYDPSITVPQIAYNRDFSIVDLKESVASLLELKNVEAGSEFQREIARAAVTLLGRYQKIAPERQQKIYEEINSLNHTERAQ